MKPWDSHGHLIEECKGPGCNNISTIFIERHITLEWGR